MGLPIALAIASTAVGFFGAMSAARAAKRQAALQARMIKQEKQRAALRALQEHNARLTGYKSALGTNIAIAGVSGRAISQDRSLKAIQNKFKKEMATETDRAFLQNLSEQAKLSSQQSMALEKGRNLSKAYQYQAFGTLFSGAMKAQPLMGSSPTSSALSPAFKRVGYGSGIVT
jgi:hypothetical protein